jgi:hypothetical protein
VPAGPRAVVFAGLPSTVRSTLAELIARAIGAAAFSSGWLLGSLAPHGVLDGVDRGRPLGLYYDLLGALLTRQSMLDNARPLGRRGLPRQRHHHQALAGRSGRPWCSAVRRRVRVRRRGVGREWLAGRRRGIPGWHQVGWDSAGIMWNGCGWSSRRCATVYAVEPVEANMRLVLRHVSA